MRPMQKALNLEWGANLTRETTGNLPILNLIVDTSSTTGFRDIAAWQQVSVEKA